MHERAGRRVPLRPPAADLALLGVAVLGVSASAPIIVALAAPALAIALWRTVLGGGVLLGVALLRSGAAAYRLDRAERTALLLASASLAAHFATWVPSVTLTSVASSTALVATQPVWNALLAQRRGEVVGPRAWAGIALAFAGVLVLTGVDLASSARAVWGDVLALIGGITAAFYVEFGARARQTMSTTAYAGLCYSLCAAGLLVLCLAARVPLAGYSTATWGGILALTVLAQLVGHTLINRALRTIAPVVVALAILLEPAGATALAAVWLGQIPPFAVLPAAVLVVAGVALVVGSERRSATDPVG